MQLGAIIVALFEYVAWTELSYLSLHLQMRMWTPYCFAITTKCDSLEIQR